MEGFLFASQEQALRTKWFRSAIQKEDIGQECRMCGLHKETVSHLVSGCSKLAQGPYKRRHDHMGLRIYWEMCRKNGIPCSEKWFEEVPDTIRKSKDNKFEIWWDRPVETTIKLDHYRPDVVLIDRAAKHWTIVDFSVPWDKNVNSKEDEKILRYLPLAKDITKVHKVSTKVIPIVIGGLGVVPKRLTGYLKELGIPDVVGGLQTSALIGTHNILRKVLNKGF